MYRKSRYSVIRCIDQRFINSDISSSLEVFSVHEALESPNKIYGDPNVRNVDFN